MPPVLLAACRLMGQGLACFPPDVFVNLDGTDFVGYVVVCFCQKRRRRIDRSMIGEPTNFVHTTHVGSGDMGMGLPSVSFLLFSRAEVGSGLQLKRNEAINVADDFSLLGRPRSGPDEV